MPLRPAMPTTPARTPAKTPPPVSQARRRPSASFGQLVMTVMARIATAISTPTRMAKMRISGDQMPPPSKSRARPLAVSARRCAVLAAVQTSSRLSWMAVTRLAIIAKPAA